ncbi:LysE family translocator [Corynebacterium silvaticum]|uniref:LysE family translocator n=1 Tax=Corynebacterium silvaticum TaxID=2320431 RepID=A0A7Y4P9Y2_9CORY|nr:LysE family translocator [Corynebacterium silvaticum]ARU45260.1 LysE family translocator [Corynebacterium silvaticum]NON70925.1 LysE family translocator [Corynebacterium silvaticum]UWH00372.1 LysE family translocator [Corynebacterium silvaticum]UWH02417.1 LysE family translocator [Corynebacterium silvaticum]UWH04454.1 LysE family translocator [Corynebacterium silvaticum]
MTIGELGALFVVWICVLILPGPDLLLQVIRVGTKDRRAGIWCAIGIMMGSTIWIVASLMGLSTVFMAQPVLMRLVQIIGGCYIAWIGFSSLKSGIQEMRDHKHGPSPDMIVNSLQQDNGALTPFHALKTGMATNLSNPKALVFFASVFAQFLHSDMSVAWTIFIAVFLITIGLCWFISFAVMVRVLAEKLLRNGLWLDMIAGTLFVIIAAVMVFEGITGIVQ